MTNQGSSYALVILAAGMGSRYGGMKQMDEIGPHGETIMDYAIYDAIRTGFDKVIFVIREDFAAEFKSRISSKYSAAIEVDHVYQSIDACTANISYPHERTKPWGTGHALLCAKDRIDRPFAVINADDFYGHGGMQAAASFLKDCALDARDGAMVAYRLDKTLSDHGSVNRGVCTANDDHMLSTIEEHTNIHTQDNEVIGTNEAGEEVALHLHSLVSMNFWALPPSVLSELEASFHQFLQTDGDRPKAEFYLPAFLDAEIQAGRTAISVLPTTSQWHGVTYQQDKPVVQEALKLLHTDGSYPSKLEF